MADVLPCIGKVIIDIFIGARFPIFYLKPRVKIWVIVFHVDLILKKLFGLFPMLASLISFLIKAKRLLSIQ